MLRRWLTEDLTDFGGNVIPAMLAGGARVYGYRFEGYWQDVGTIQSYWDANMELVEDPPPFDLYDPRWVTHTRSEERPPARLIVREKKPENLEFPFSALNRFVTPNDLFYVRNHFPAPEVFAPPGVSDAASELPLETMLPDPPTLGPDSQVDPLPPEIDDAAARREPRAG